MTDVYADYDFYVNDFYGNAIPEKDFPRYASRASDYIRAATNGVSDKFQEDWTRAATTSSAIAMFAIKKCTCAIAEVILDESIMEASAFSGGQAVSSESVGSWSKSYEKSSLSAEQVEYLNKRKQDFLWLYLGGLAAFSNLFRVKSYRCVPGGH